MVSLEEIGQVTVKDLIDWMQQEKFDAGNLSLNESNLIVKSALESYRENLDFMQQDVLRLAKGIVFEKKSMLKDTGIS